MPQQDVSSYRLSQSESHRIFTSEILSAEFKGRPRYSAPSSSSSRPSLAVLIVGQTGAGRTRLSSVILSAFQSMRGIAALHLIADTYNTYQPAYAQMIMDSPQLASPATGPDARKWLAMTSEDVVRCGLDVLLESACRHPGDFVQLLNIFREAEYRVEVVALAVPAALSRLGILFWFYETLPEGKSRDLPARLTPTKVHDESYAGVLDVAAFLGDGDMADQALVVRRGNFVAYSKMGGRGSELGNAGGIVDALKRERKRPLTKEENEVALDNIQKLTAHEEASEQVKQAKSLLRPLIAEGTGGDAVSRGSWPELRTLSFVETAKGGVSSCNALFL